MKLPESELAHKLLDGKIGLEIGGSAHNPFGLHTKNVDFTEKMDTTFKIEEVKYCGEAMSVDIVASGDKLPVESNSQDFVISSHVLEHFPDPIKALKEWYRVVRDEGYIFMIIPHKERTFDKDRERTTLQELIVRHNDGIKVTPKCDHYSVWVTEDIIELINYLGWNIIISQDIDDKVGNGFTVVVQKNAKQIVDLSLVSNRAKEILFSKCNCILRDKNDVEELAGVLENIYPDMKKNDDQIKELEKKITLMESSKFWRIRNKYIKLKRSINPYLFWKTF